MKTISIIFAGICWFVIFSPWTREAVPFWPSMMGVTAVLTAIALISERHRLTEFLDIRFRDAVTGILSAILLYGIFFLVYLIVSGWFPALHRQVTSVYSTAAGRSSCLTAIVLLFWLGPAEEIFWRFFIQHRIRSRIGACDSLLITALLYSAVHLPSGNLMLVAAAVFCGVYWGLIYLYTRSIWAVIISHAVWDVVIFVAAPLLF